MTRQTIPTNRDALRDALRKLPVVAPPDDVWAEIERRTDGTSHRPGAERWWVGAAAAAAFVIAAGVWLLGRSPATTEASDIASLVAQSQQLERRVARHRTQSDTSAWSASRRVLVYRIADLDRELAPLSIDPARDPVRAETLWRQRVALMQSLAELDRTDAPRRALAL